VRLRLWIFGLPTEEYEIVLKELKDLDFTDIVITTPDAKQIRAAKDRGFRVHAVVVAFRLDKSLRRPEYLAEDPLGRKHIWFNSGCPNNPSIRKKSLEKVKEWIEKYEVNGVILDGIRFASPGSGLSAFMTCFCKHCEEKAKEMGFNFKRMKNAALDFLRSLKNVSRLMHELMKGHYINLFHLLISYDGLLDWIEFRTRCIVEHIRNVRNVVKSVDSSIELGAYVFTPSLAPLVGQCYYKIVEHLDLVKPMIYRIGRGVACFNYELYIIAKDLLTNNPMMKEEEILKFIYNTFSLTGELPMELSRLLKSGLPHAILKREALIARALISSKGTLHPIIMLHDEEIEKATRLVLQAKVDGVDFFAFKKELMENVKVAARIVKTLKG